MIRQNLLGNTVSQMEKIFQQMGERPYRGRQLFKWLYNNRQYDFQSMTDLSKEVRTRLLDNYEFRLPSLQMKSESKDGTVKFLFRLDDGLPVETVLIPDEDRQTLCVSSQSGCALACRFCATGTMGLKRNLSVGEIVGQLLHVRESYGADAYSNVVFMGMGEPFNNYNNLVEALRIMTSSLGLGIAARKITVSTSGITPLIRRYADSKLKANLALSLHAAFQEKREAIMPVARTYRLDKLMDAIRYYTQQTGRRVTFEYILFEGFNDTMEDVLSLTRLVQGIPCKINVLAYNPVPGLDFTRPSDEQVDWFARMLYPRTPAVTVRKSRGQDIAAACGQLAAQMIQ
ncbi:MAG: 23S rRNA (adenine(2503)-C(2))-methyltransferase RlmN [Candidatus Zixiibacteriota bacterium]